MIGNAIRRLKWYEIVLLLGSIAVLSVVPAAYVGMGGKSVPITNIRQISPDVPLIFPSDAVVINGEYHTGFGAYLIAKVRFKKAEVHAFISQPLLASNGTNSHSEFMEWISETPEIRRFDWRLKSIRRYWAIDGVLCKPNDGNSQAFILIDLDHSEYVDVYIDRQYN